jgi:tRNA nucleotidyltransferase (CCA-adding enzyme)
MMSSAAIPENLRQMSVPAPVLGVVSRLRDHGFQAFLVGGCVRDMVRGIKPSDYDVATNALPEDVERLFRRVVSTGRQHGTMTVLTGGRPVEVTTFRTEGAYLDGRRPSSVEFHGSIEDDLSRRDLTINAMAYDPIAHDLRDPFGGQEDLAVGLIRCVGDPDSRFREDGLRPLRAIRFAAVLGFTIDPTTQAAIPRSISTFRRIAVERIREEFCKLLLSPRPASGVELLRTTGMLEVFLPEILEGVGVQNNTYGGDVYGHCIATLQAIEPDLDLRLAALLHDVAKPRTLKRNAESSEVEFPGHETVGATLAGEILERLRFPRKTIDAVVALVAHHRLDRLPTAPDGEVRRFIASVGEENVQAHLQLAQANRRASGGGSEEGLQELSHLAGRVRAILSARPPLQARALALDGSDIMRVLGVGPSPVVGEATRFLLERVLEDPKLNSPDRLTELLQKWAQSKGR